MQAKQYIWLALFAASLLPQAGSAQELSMDIRQHIGKYLDDIARKEVSIGRIQIDSIAVSGKTLQLFANMNCAVPLPVSHTNATLISEFLELSAFSFSSSSNLWL